MLVELYSLVFCQKTYVILKSLPKIWDSSEVQNNYFQEHINFNSYLILKFSHLSQMLFVHCKASRKSYMGLQKSM